MAEIAIAAQTQDKKTIVQKQLVLRHQKFDYVSVETGLDCDIITEMQVLHAHNLTDTPEYRQISQRCQALFQAKVNELARQAQSGGFGAMKANSMAF